MTITVTARDGGGPRHVAHLHRLAPRGARHRRRPGDARQGDARSPAARTASSSTSQTTTIATLRLEPPASATWSCRRHDGDRHDRRRARGRRRRRHRHRDAAGARGADHRRLLPVRPPGAVGGRPPTRCNSRLDAHRGGREPERPRLGRRADPDARGAADASIGAGTAITVDGYASYEGVDTTPARSPHNDDSASAGATRWCDPARRGLHGRHARGAPRARRRARPHRDRRQRPRRRRATRAGGGPRARTAVPATAEVVTARVTRPPPPAPATVDPRPPAAGTPDCFRKLGVRVELVRGTFIRAELYGEIDIETAAEAASARARASPRCGRGRATRWTASACSSSGCASPRTATRGASRAEFRAAEADLDGLAQMDSAHSNPGALDILGALAVLAPLTSSATELSPAAGALVALGTVALGASDLMHTQKLILRGAELIVVRTASSAPTARRPVDDRGTQVSVLLDIEVAFTFDLTIVRVDPQHPITTRYKAIGVRSHLGHRARRPAALDYVPLPVFDPSRGYSLDIPTGSLTASPPLDEHPARARLPGQPRQPDLPRGRGRPGARPRHRHGRHRAGARPARRAAARPAADQARRHARHAGHAARQGLASSSRRSASRAPSTSPSRRSTSAPPPSLAVETQDGVTGVLDRRRGRVPGADPARQLGPRHLRLPRRRRRQLRAQRGPVASQVPALDWLQAQLAAARRRHGPGRLDDDARRLRVRRRHAARHRRGRLRRPPQGHRADRGAGAAAAAGHEGRRAVGCRRPSKSDQTATFLAVLDIDFGRGTITIGIVAEYAIERC